MVIARVERKRAEPHLLREPLDEVRMRDDLSAVRGRAAGDAADAAVQGVGSCDLGSAAEEAAGGEGLGGIVG